MPTSDLITRLEREFTPNQARVLAEEIEAVGSDLVRARDFSELKEIVREIGVSQRELIEAQKRTETRVEELAVAQKRTETRVEELAEAQKRTEEEIRKLTISQLRLENGFQGLRQEVGGLSNAIGFMLENEAYRHLPALLAAKYKINISSRIIRQQVGSEEVNQLAEGKRGKTPVLIIGEVKSRLAAHHLTQLKKKIKEVEKHYPAAAGREIVPIMVVQFARAKELLRAERESVIVVQSFEW